MLQKRPQKSRFLSLGTVKGLAFAVTILTLYSVPLLSPFPQAGATAPVTTATLDPSTPDGDNSWYVTPVDITLEATDLESGVKEVNYRIDEGSWVQRTYGNTLNLVLNPSFELYGAQPPLNIDDWELANPLDTASFSRTTAESFPGAETRSLEIGSTDPGWHAVNHQEEFSVATPFSNMSASAQIKTSAAALAYFKVYAVSLDAFSQPVYTQLAQSTTLAGTWGWTQVTSNFVVSIADAIGVYVEIGLEGPGTIWVDAVTLTEALTTASVDFTVASDGEHTVDYYSVDRMDNTEVTKTVSFKIDQTPPSNWHDAGAFRGWFGSSHRLWVYVTVEDATSGLSVFTDEYQYHVDDHAGFGSHASLLNCNSDWQPDSWTILITPPFSPGAKSAFLLTPKTDFCNSNWKICKTVRFSVEDMAGNGSMQDFCINGPWIKFRGQGIVGAKTYISMVSEPEDDNTDGLIELGQSTTNFFTSQEDWNIKNYTVNTEYSYDALWDATSEKTEITDGDLVTESGVFVINGDFEIDNQSTPSQYDNRTFDQIVFVDGDLTISRDIETDETATAFFVVNGNINIAKQVNTVGIALFANGTLDTCYDIAEGDSTQTLNLNGIFVANKILFKRTLQGTNNNDVPSENFVYEPKYLVGLRGFFKGGSIKWID
jgi:hypothetical protein